MRFAITTLSSVALCTQAAAAEFRWTLAFAQGGFEAIVRNEHGSSLNIYCPSGQTDTTPGMFIDVAKVKPAAGEKVEVQIIVDGTSHAFTLDETQFVAKEMPTVSAH